MALISVLGGIYFLSGRAGLPSDISPWIFGSAVVSVVAGVLLWLRVPHVKWLGVLPYAVILGIFARSLILKGWSVVGCLQLLLPVVCAWLMARIDYAHVFVDEDDA